LVLTGTAGLTYCTQHEIGLDTTAATYGRDLRTAT
jgi:hypothetical protein